MKVYIVNIGQLNDDSNEFSFYSKEVFSSLKKAKEMMEHTVWNELGFRLKVTYPATISARPSSDEMWDFSQGLSDGNTLRRRLHLEVQPVNESDYEDAYPHGVINH